MPRIPGLQVALALVVAGGATEAAAQQKKSPEKSSEKSSRTMQLFGGALGPAVSGDTLGMRPGTAGAIARFQLSLASTNNLSSSAAAPRRLEVTLPDGRSVTCLLRPVRRPRAMVVLGGTTVGGGEGDRCNLVIENGRVTGEVDLESGRYRIQPIGAGATHAVVEIKTENLPDELTPKLPPNIRPNIPPKIPPKIPAKPSAVPSPQRAATDTAPCDVKPA